MTPNTGLDHTEPCKQCGNPVHTAPGIDNHITLTHKTTESMTQDYYCDYDCLTEQLTTND